MATNESQHPAWQPTRWSRPSPGHERQDPGGDWYSESAPKQHSGLIPKSVTSGAGRHHGRSAPTGPRCYSSRSADSF